MATPTLAELFTQLTPEQIETSSLEVAQTLELPVTAWEDGSVGREMIVIFCTMMSTYLSGSSTTAAAAKLLDYAEDEWLHLTGKQVFDVDPVEATFATCTERLTNSSLVPYTIAADELRFATDPSNGTSYLNTTGGSLPAWSGSGAYPTLDVSIIAENPGSIGSAAAGAIVEMVTPIAGVTATNTTPAVGTDAEKDPAYKLRCRESAARLSPNGPADAYNYFAKSTVRGDDTNCGVTRTFPDQPLEHPGTVVLYVASAAGPVAPSDVVLVQANLVANCQPTGITVSTVSAVAYEITVRATVYLAPGSSSTSGDVAAVALEALTDFFGALAIGGTVLSPGEPGYLFLDMLIATVVNSSDQVVQAVITNISNDLAMAKNQVAVLTSVVADINVVAT